MADERMVDLLRSQSKDDRFDLEFIDYSVHEPFDERWKSQCRERIAQTSTVVVMIGRETYMRPAVLWEIKEAYRQGKQVIGVIAHRDQHCPIPRPLLQNRAKIVNWNMKEIQDAIYED